MRGTGLARGERVIDLSSETTVLTLVGMAALLTAAALALERAGILPDAGWVLRLSLPVNALGVVRLLHFDGPTGPTFPTVAAFGVGLGILVLEQKRSNRARHAEVFATIAPAIDGEVVASDRLEGRWSTYSVEVGLGGSSTIGMDAHACHTVTLHVGSGGCAWSVRHGRRPGAWRWRRWYVKSRNQAVAQTLESLGAPTLVAHRYRHVEPFSAELETPRIHYDADRGRLSYVVVAAGGRMTSLTLEQFQAQLDLLGRLAELDRQANRRSGEPRAYRQASSITIEREARWSSGPRQRPDHELEY